MALDLGNVTRGPWAVATPRGTVDLRAPHPGEIAMGALVRLKMPKPGFAVAGETATVEETDRDRDTFIVAFDSVRTLRLYGSDEGTTWERF